MGEIIFITGTDTGVGKTVLTALLLAHLRDAGIHAVATKPFCTGSSADARLLFELQDREIPLGVVNPFHFRMPVAPMVAARSVKRNLSFEDVIARIRSLQRNCDVLLIEGSGGLLVPVGEDFMISDMIKALSCHVVVAARNKLGVINHTLLTMRALEDLGLDSTTIVLMSEKNFDVSSRTNDQVLTKQLKRHRVESVPFLSGDLQKVRVIRAQAVGQKKLLARIAARSIVRTAFRSGNNSEMSRRLGAKFTGR